VPTARFPQLAKYADDKLSLSDAIRKFTSLPAQREHLADRGVIKQGMWADLVVFDPAKVRDEATYADPNKFSVGMQHVIVNGVAVIEDGKMTGKLPGKVLRGAGYAAH
jgi:dihydroorotase/N-acyl-D-amino-acid deacylase